MTDLTETSDGLVTQERRTNKLRVALTITVLVGSAALVRYALDSEAVSRSSRGGFETLAISLPLLIAASWSWVPSEAIAVAQGAALGFVGGTLAATTGWTIVAVAQYEAVRRGLLGSDPERLLARAPARLRRLPVTHPLFLIACRQLPFGSKIVNLAGPLVGVPLWRHTWCAALGVAPTAAVCAALGAGAVAL